jgi:hypothetical protein
MFHIYFLNLGGVPKNTCNFFKNILDIASTIKHLYYSGRRLMVIHGLQDQSVNGIKFILIEKSQITLSYLILLLI